MKFVKGIIDFIQTYPGVLYSLFLIIFIPAALAYNTFFTASSFQKNIDRNLQTEALIIENIFNSFALDIVGQTDLLQRKVDQALSENPEIAMLRVLEEQDGKFRVIASHDKSELGNVAVDANLVLSWTQNQTIANLTVQTSGERFWNVVQPMVLPETQQPVGLLAIALSLQESDKLIASSIFRSYVITALMIFLSFILIIQHTRLFGYVELSKKLLEIDRLKDDFIRMATHELQTPIVAIRGYALALEEELSQILNETQRVYVSRVKISAENLSQLIYDILEVARIDQQRLDLTPKMVDPGAIIQEVVDELRPLAEKKNLNLLLQVEQGSWRISVNPERLRQILVNLVNNAIKYTLQGEVEVQGQQDEARRRYLILVRDTGLGIPAEAQKRIFERFYRVRTKETADIAGTGLGLWISNQLTQQMGGTIAFESMEGVGTKFVISFPLASR